MYCRSSGYLRKVLVVPSKASGQVSFRKIDVAPRHTPTPIIDKVPKNTTGKYSFLQPFQCWPQGWWFCHLIGVFWQYSVSPVFIFVLHLHFFCTLFCICVWSDWLLVVSCIWLVFAIWHIRTPIRFHQSSAITISNSADVWRKKSRISDLFICDTHIKENIILPIWIGVNIELILHFKKCPHFWGKFNFELLGTLYDSQKYDLHLCICY